ncbi:hypothetical protein [Streptomyces sp. NPDC007100]|uniref:hypothetical protein n=1 Tax=Streptomyces sp. NPDC007100 TaxID=3155602 RepID=UPI0033DD5294
MATPLSRLPCPFRAPLPRSGRPRPVPWLTLVAVAYALVQLAFVVPHTHTGLGDGSPCTRSHHPANGTWCVSNWDPADYGSHVTVHAYFRLYSGSRQINDTSTNSPSITVSFTGMAHC